MSFLGTPYDNIMHKTKGDNFNFFHSSSRIIIECTFGKVDLCWGILWRKLGFNMEHNANAIDACLHLHNFIVDFREEVEAIPARSERSLFDEDCRRFLTVHPTTDASDASGVFGGEEEEKRDANGNRLVGGRPLKRELESKAHGKLLRDMLQDEIRRRQWVRHSMNYYKDKNRVLDVLF